MKNIPMPVFRNSAGRRHFASQAIIAALLLACSLPATFAYPDQTAPGAAQKQDLTDLSLEELGQVRIVSASLHPESERDAPASVTVITGEDIRKFGYRTLAEALSWVPGFFTSSDYTYSTVGIRGFAMPGFEMRFLIMIDGHNLADNIEDSASVDEDMPVDLDLIDRIEVVRGPSSALYGSAAILATINIITRKPASGHGVNLRLETGSLGERKLEANTSVAIAKSADLLLSASVFNDQGPHQLYFSEFDTPQTNFGRAIDMNGQKGYHAFADLTWGNWDLMATAGDRVIVQPISWGNTVFNDRGTRAEDSRAFVMLSYNKTFSDDRTLSWTTSYDASRYRGIYHYEMDDGSTEDSRERDYGDWLGSRLTYRLPDSGTGHLTLGTDLRFDLRALQNAYDILPEPVQWLRVNRPDRYAGVFAQQEWTLGTHWEVNLGARLDWSWLKRSAVSPRVAVIYKPSNQTDLKLLYGRGFRNPSSYDMFWADGFTQLGNSNLRSETTDTYEIDVEHAFNRRLRGSVSAYHYQIDNLIMQVFTETGLTQYVNADRARAAGMSFDLQYLLPSGIRFGSSLEIQRAVFRSSGVLPNSPGQVGKLRVSVPFCRDRFAVTAGLQALGQRQTYAGDHLAPAILPEASVSTKRLAAGFELTAGIKNLSNSSYRDPVGLTPAVDSVIALGRTYFLNVTWRAPLEARRSQNGGKD